VAALNATLGVQLDVGGEKIFIVDETGAIVGDVEAAALMLELALYANPGRACAATVVMPSALDTIASWHNAPLHRIGMSASSMMSAASMSEMLLICDGTGSYIFPDFLPAVDGLMATIKLLEYLAVRQIPVSEIVSYLPPMHLAKGSVHCAWESKGLVMRLLTEAYKNDRVENMDGLKVYSGEDAWIHVSPHVDKPVFEVVAEAGTQKLAEEMVQQKLDQIELFRRSSAQ
jgi:mannose-1-phosphate guanylyltransferase/phosphomannomutase